MSLGERILKRLTALGMSQSRLAREVGISPQAIHKMVGGHTVQTAHIYLIAKALQTTPEYLAGETDDPAPPKISEPCQHQPDVPMAPDLSAPEDDDLVKVHEIDLRFGMGATYLEVPVTATVRQFDRNWLRAYTTSRPEHLFFCEGIGNSMEPCIMSHDLLLIDTAQKDVRVSDQIWAVAYGACGSIKRLRPMADGSVKMMCDNPSVSDEVAYDGELQVIGRVVAIVRKF